MTLCHRPTQPSTRTVLGTPLAVDDPAAFRLASMRYSGAEVERAGERASTVETTKQHEKFVAWGVLLVVVACQCCSSSARHGRAMV